MKCKDCKYWKIPKHQTKSYCCKLGYVNADDMSKDDLSIECIHDSLIYTGPEFGCIHFEKVVK